jgi:hypothetical protein
MTPAYAVVSMGSAAGHDRAYAVWAYDMDKPRAQRPDLPQGQVIGLVGVYSSRPAAMLAAENAIDGGA